MTAAFFRGPNARMPAASSASTMPLSLIHIYADAHMTGRLQPFGYVTLTAARDNLLCRAGERIRAHEFHYAQSGDNGAAFRAEKPNGRAWDCVHATETLYAGFPHLYLRANPAFAQNFVRACAQKR